MNMSDMWVLDTYLPTTQGQYIKLRDGPQPSAYDTVKTDDLTVQWSTPVTRGLPSLGRFGHAAYFYSRNRNWITDVQQSTRTDWEGLVVYGGMRFGGSLGLFDLWKFKIADVDANVLLVDAEEIKVPGAAPPADLKGHSTSYVGGNLLVLGGSSRVEAEEQDALSEKMPEHVEEDKGLLPNKAELKELLSLDSCDEKVGEGHQSQTVLPQIATSNHKGLEPKAPPSPCSRVPTDTLQLPPLTSDTSGPEHSKEIRASKRKLKIHVLDAITLSWSVPKIEGDIPDNRISHGAELWGRTVVLTGGFDTMKDGEIDRKTRLVKTDAERILWDNLNVQNCLLLGTSLNNPTAPYQLASFTMRLSGFNAKNVSMDLARHQGGFMM